jgi:signal transduction histidine kinase/CheY-like chemotaxis protein
MRWLGRVRSADPVRRSLNSGLAWVLLSIAVLAVLMSGVLVAIGRPPLTVGIVAITAPLCLVCWWLNRRGSAAGALAFVALMICATAAAIDPHLYAGPVPEVDVAFMYSVVAAALFVRPTAGLVALALQLAALTVALALSDIPRGQALAFLAEALLEMGAMTALVTVAAKMFVRALSEHRKIDAERRAREAAEAANAAKNAFLASMSHELRTPLNAILGFSELIEMDTTVAANSRRQARLIHDSGEHLLALIEDLLDIARIEAGRLELFPAPLDLPSLLEGIGATAQLRAQTRRNEFVYAPAPDLPQAVVADEKRLRQVLLNLLDNANKFTERDRVVLRVQRLPSNATHAVRLRFEVEDKGPGIAPEHLETVFRPFEQVGEARQRQGGAGLGLAISQQLVRLMGGDIGVVSRLGSGSSFSFEIDVPLAEALPAAAPRRAPTGYAGPRRSVLVADDVALNRALLRDVLAPLGFEVHEANDGLEALAQAQRLRPHLVLIDSVMPGLDGASAIARMRATPGLQQAYVIGISASAMAADRERCLAAGADAFMPKPLDVASLLDHVAQGLALTWTYGPDATAA